MRIERDLLGEKELPDDALYGINSARAEENFSLDYKKTSLRLIYAAVKIKKAAAITYRKLGIKAEIYSAVVSACDEILSGAYDDQFVTDALQGGAGTSVNMNVNEVVANIALKRMGKPIGSYDIIHPLDDVNRGQSTNDVYPTALRIAAIELLRELSDKCAGLQERLQRKEQQFLKVKKLGRTELMDAVEITLGEEFGAYSCAIARDRWRLYKIEERLRQVNLGGTAVGLSDNAARRYRFAVLEELRELTDIGLAASEYPMDITQNNDVFVEASGLLKALAVNLMKISNDLRLMNSGPFGGIGEVRLAALQQGSTIMPAKINPVIPEMTMQCAMKVIANDSCIAQAAAHGEFELNAFLPLIADCLLESLSLMCRATELFGSLCIDRLDADTEVCKRNLEGSAAFGIKYTTALGYDRVSEVLKNNPPEKAHEILQEMFKNAGN